MLIDEIRITDITEKKEIKLNIEENKMGCDINWYACEPLIKNQIRASKFLMIVLKKMGLKISNKDCNDYELFEEQKVGYFVNLQYINNSLIDNPETLILASQGKVKPAIPNDLKPRSRHFQGFSSFLEGKPDYSNDYYKYWRPDFLAEWQLTMVFNNSPIKNTTEKFGELVTIERLEDVSLIFTHEMTEKLNESNEGKAFQVFVYKPGGNTRTAGQKDFFALMFLIKKLFIPSLTVIDDYNYFSDFQSEMKNMGLNFLIGASGRNPDSINFVLKNYLHITLNEDEIEMIL